MRLALYDLDNTLIAGDSDFEWAQFLLEQGVLDREVYEARNVEFYQQYKEGTLDIHEFLDFQLKPLSRHPRRELDAWHLEFMRRKILPLVLPRARELVARNQGRGDLCAIVTATNSFVTAPIAREFGVAHLLATEPEQAGGEFTGAVAGTPCFREGKVATEGMFGQQIDEKRAWTPNYDLFFFEVATSRGIKMLNELQPGEMGRLVVSTPILAAL